MLGTIELIGIGAVIALVWASIVFYYAAQKRFKDLEERMIHNVQITLKELDDLKAKLKDKDKEE